MKTRIWAASLVAVSFCLGTQIGRTQMPAQGPQPWSPSSGCPNSTGSSGVCDNPRGTTFRQYGYECSTGIAQASECSRCCRYSAWNVYCDGVFIGNHNAFYAALSDAKCYAAGGGTDHACYHNPNCGVDAST